jgi:purine nucleosidase
VPYRTEDLQISESEASRIRAWLRADVAAGPRGPVSRSAERRRRKIILDTDIGTDVDDALALLLLLELPEDNVELLGVTTVYGYSHVRAAVAEHVIRGFESECDRPGSIPVLAGESTPLGTHRPVWHTGTEGHGLLAQEELEHLKTRADFVVANGHALVPVTAPEEQSERHAAARWIAEQTRRFPGGVTIVSIGQLTNVAVALEVDPGMKDRVERLVHMAVGGRMPRSDLPDREYPCGEPQARVVSGAGTAWFHYPNHNVSGDTLAAARVYASGMRIDVIPHLVTGQLWWGEAPVFELKDREMEVARRACLDLMAATAPRHTAAVGTLLRVWLDHRSSVFGCPVRGTCPHDALTVAEAAYPGRFLDFSEPGHLLVHEWGGFATFVCVPGGPHRMATEVRARLFIEFMSEHLRPVAPSS